MKSTKSYRVIELLQKVPRENLTPHPQALMPMDDEDKLSVKKSIEENGIIQPLLVMKSTRKDFYEILDGVNRWEQAETVNEFDCLLVECDNPRQVVLECLSSGRKRTTGQRIMVYLEQHKTDVLTAWAINVKKGENYRKSSNRSSDRLDEVTINDFSAEAIAARLHCSDRDVRAGIELLDCLYNENSAIRKYAEMAAKYTEEELLKNTEEQRLHIMAGSCGIRRWRSAVGGKSTTKGKERKDVDYAQCTLPAATTLTNAFARWSTIEWDKDDYSRRGHTIAFTQISTMLDCMPESVRSSMRKKIIEKWPEAEKKELFNALKKSLKG